jgi:hypothetical protein
VAGVRQRDIHERAPARERVERASTRAATLGVDARASSARGTPMRVPRTSPVSAAV